MDAGALTDDDSSAGYALNQAGDTVMASWRSTGSVGQMRAALWPWGGLPRPIFEPGRYGVASGINEHGEVVGWRVPPRWPSPPAPRMRTAFPSSKA